MATEKLDKLSEQEIFNLIFWTTSGEMCKENSKNTLVRGEVYSIKSVYPKTIIGQLIFGRNVNKIKFTDDKIIEYTGKRRYIIHIAYDEAKKKFLTPAVQEETNTML